MKEEIIRPRIQFCRKCRHKFWGRENGYCEDCRCLRCSRKAMYKSLRLCEAHYANWKYHNRLDFREKQKQASHEWSSTHRERRREQQRSWRRLNHEEVIQQERVRYRKWIKNPENRKHVSEYYKQYYVKRNLLEGS